MARKNTRQSMAKNIATSILIYFLFLLALTIWNLSEIKKVGFLSWKTVNLVLLYAVMFTVATCILLLYVLFVSLFSLKTSKSLK